MDTNSDFDVFQIAFNSRWGDQPPRDSAFSASRDWYREEYIQRARAPCPWLHILNNIYQDQIVAAYSHWEEDMGDVRGIRAILAASHRDLSFYDLREAIVAQEPKIEGIWAIFYDMYTYTIECKPEEVIETVTKRPTEGVYRTPPQPEERQALSTLKTLKALISIPENIDLSEAEIKSKLSAHKLYLGNDFPDYEQCAFFNSKHNYYFTPIESEAIVSLDPRTGVLCVIAAVARH